MTDRFYELNGVATTDKDRCWPLTGLCGSCPCSTIVLVPNVSLTSCKNRIAVPRV